MLCHYLKKIKVGSVISCKITEMHKNSVLMVITSYENAILIIRKRETAYKPIREPKKRKEFSLGFEKLCDKMFYGLLFLKPQSEKC